MLCAWALLHGEWEEEEEEEESKVVDWSQPLATPAPLRLSRHTVTLPLFLASHPSHADSLDNLLSLELSSSALTSASCAAACVVL